jgi:transposase
VPAKAPSRRQPSWTQTNRAIYARIFTAANSNPTGFHLTPGQAHDLEGADALLPGIEADALLADKAYDADERVIEPLRHAEIEPVIPTKANRKEPRPYDKDLYKARSLIENFFCKLKQFRAIATRYDKTARNFLAAIHSSLALRVEGLARLE